MTHDKDALLREAVKLLRDEWDGTSQDSIGNLLIARITAALEENPADKTLQNVVDDHYSGLI